MLLEHIIADNILSAAVALNASNGSN